MRVVGFARDLALEKTPSVHAKAQLPRICMELIARQRLFYSSEQGKLLL
jgi:hypothetical protein